VQAFCALEVDYNPTDAIEMPTRKQFCKFKQTQFCVSLPLWEATLTSFTTQMEIKNSITKLQPLPFCCMNGQQTGNFT